MAIPFRQDAEGKNNFPTTSNQRKSSFSSSAGGAIGRGLVTADRSLVCGLVVERKGERGRPCCRKRPTTSVGKKGEGEAQGRVLARVFITAGGEGHAVSCPPAQKKAAIFLSAERTKGRGNPWMEKALHLPAYDLSDLEKLAGQIEKGKDLAVVGKERKEGARSPNEDLRAGWALIIVNRGLGP